MRVLVTLRILAPPSVKRGLPEDTRLRRYARVDKAQAKWEVDHDLQVRCTWSRGSMRLGVVEMG